MSDSPTHVVFDGEAGAIDCAIDWPAAAPPRGWALVLHPHPLHGGARGNKVVTTIARACTQEGLVVIRPDFRGVGASEGTFDSARGETADMVALVAQWRVRFPELANAPWVLAGFSFGTAVAAQLHATLADAGSGVMPSAVVLAGPAVKRFLFRDIALPADTLLIHGVQDEVVPLSEARAWAEQEALEISLVEDASHFFHGKLIELKALVTQKLQSSLAG